MSLASPLFFDSCTHPTLNGDWTNGRPSLTFRDLAQIRQTIPGYSALAIGLPGVGGYSHREFKRECDIWGFTGIAAVTTLEDTPMEREFHEIVELGFRGVKVHPRLLKRNTDISYLSKVFSLCDKFGLVCLLCTYEADRPGCLPSSDPFYQLCNALNEVPNVRLILMHGGGPRISQFASLARHSDTILIDLSFTIMDQLTANLDATIQDLMVRLDQRLCIGSDSPEFGAPQVIQRINGLANNLEITKLNNILSNNLLRFFPPKI